MLIVPAAAGAGPGRGPQPAVWRGAAVLRRRWPPSPCRGAAPCGLRLVAGGGGWCWCGRDIFRDLEAAGAPLYHVNRYILWYKAHQPGGDLEISTIIDPLNPKIILTETLANIRQVTSAPDHPGWRATEVTKASLGPLAIETAKDVAKLQAFSQILQPDLVNEIRIIAQLAPLAKTCDSYACKK
jgi:hypothetical protein